MSERASRRNLHDSRERIETQPAHGINRVRREGFNADPEMRDGTREAASARHRRVVDGCASNQRLGMRFAQREELGKFR